MKRQKELDLGDVINVRLDEQLDFSTLCPFQDTEEPDIERLGKMRGMRR